MNKNEDHVKKLVEYAMSYQSRLPEYVKGLEERQCGYDITNIVLSPEQVTFKGKMKEPVHSWFRLTPSFSPYLVRMMLRTLNCGKDDKVLDPFAGVGTTLIECKKLGIKSIGIDINPVFCEVMKAVVKWDLDLYRLKSTVDNFLTKISERKKEIKNLDVTDFPEKLNISLPRIHNVFRWWDKAVLKDLLIAREVLKEMKIDENYRRFLWVGLAATVIEVANVERCHPTISFADNPFNVRSNHRLKEKPKNRDVIYTLSSKLNKMISDLNFVKREFGENISTEARVILGDSKYITKLIDPETYVIITSPPYPNRYSYVWETRPYLYFFEIFKKPREASDLDMTTIGGTWGRATFVLKDTVINPLNKEVDHAVGETVEKIRERSNLLANYVQKYFNEMYIHFSELSKVAENNSRCAYVIGNSKIKGVEIQSDIILANLLESVGFSIHSIVRIRTRLGKKGLYEAIIYGSK